MFENTSMPDSNSLRPNNGETQSDTRYLLQEFNNAAEFIHENWTDELGAQFARFLQNVGTELNQLEQRKVTLLESLSALRTRLYEILDDDDVKQPPQKVLKLTMHGDNNCLGGGGYSRTR